MPKPIPRGQGKGHAFLVELIGHQGEECVTWPFYRNPNGYGQLGHLRKMHWAHRMMCELASGPSPKEELEVAHSCGNGKLGCVNPRHLSWKSKSENRYDALRHGTGVIQRTGNVGSLKPEQVAEIRALKGQMRQCDIAAKFGISEPRIRAIFTNKIYRADKKIKNWTEDEDRRLREAISNRTPPRKIAPFINRPIGAITSRMARIRREIEN